MLENKAILIVEDNSYIALDFALAIENLFGRALGPAGSVDEALEILSSGEPVAGAILAARITDLDPGAVMMALVERDIPVVVHSETGEAPAFAAEFPHIPVVFQPVQPQTIISRLLIEIRRGERGITASIPVSD